MSKGRVRVERAGEGFVIRIVETQPDVVERFMQVFSKVNPAAQLPLNERDGPAYMNLYRQGPLLFNEVAVDPKTGQHQSSLGGLEVSAARLDATIAELENIGYEVVK